MKFKNRGLVDVLEKNGIKLSEVIETGVSTYIYDPKLGDNRKIRREFIEGLDKALSDINVSSLITAGISLEKLGKKGLIPGISAAKYKTDPVDLIADEILGQGIAMYLAGTRALFEFERLDKKKPGILAKLPPMMDDIIAGLISGVMVKICSK
jgi:alpha-ribazole phosphatase CobZ